MEWKEAQGKANEIGNFPANIEPCELEQYRRYSATIIFNEAQGINKDYTELLKDARHRIIAECLAR